jgi:hypothetical protein
MSGATISISALLTVCRTWYAVTDGPHPARIADVEMCSDSFAVIEDLFSTTLNISHLEICGPGGTLTIDLCRIMYMHYIQRAE